MHLRLLFLLAALSYAQASASEPVLHPGGTAWSPIGIFEQTFRLTNPTSKPIYYTGYGPSGPLTTIQALGKNRWEVVESASDIYCGTGLDDQKLAPQQSVSFTKPVPEGRAWFVEVPWGFCTKHPAFSNTARTGTIPIQFPPRPDASQLVNLTVAFDAKKRFPYTFTIKNTSGNTLYYGGFSDSGTPPDYLIQRRQLGNWIGGGKGGWCGSRFGFQPLKPDRSESFSIPAQENGAWRIGLVLFKNAQPTKYDDAYLPVWWAPQK